LIVILLLFYLITRFFNLTILPIFNDESTYLFLAKTIATTNHHWFISLIWGKGPLFIWILVGILKLFPSQDYLLAGRMVSVLFGVFTLLGIYKISLLLFKQRFIGIAASLLYILSPFALFYDRITLFDSCITAILVWFLYTALKAKNNSKITYAFFLGIFVFFTLLIKFNAIIPFILSPLIFPIFLNKKELLNNWRKITALIFIPFIFGLLSQLFLMRSSGYPYYIAQVIKYTNHANKSILPVFSLPLFLSNSEDLISWNYYYYTPFAFWSILIGFLVILKNYFRIGLFLFVFAVVPILITALIARELFPRYVLFTLPYFLITLSYLLYFVYEKSKVFFIMLTFLLIIPMFTFDSKLLTNPPLAPLPSVEKFQYISGLPSGYGLPEVFNFLTSKAKFEPITVITLGTVSSYPFAFNLEFWNNKNVTILARWPVTNHTKKEIDELKKNHKVYVILKVLTDKNHSNFLTELNLKQVFITQKPTGTYPIRVALPN